jgi:acyl-CoA thioester hydrolase
MPAIYQFRHTVRDDEIDELGHANNVAYVEWMQAAAVAHSAAQGWPGERYQRMGFGWVVRSHKIEYHQPALAGGSILIETWVATLKKATSLRRYRILRESDQTLLASAETTWAFINYKTGNPMRIPREVAEGFQVIDDRQPIGDD